MAARINVNRLQEGLHAKRFGRSIILLREVGSTNDLARELAGYGADEGTVVMAETQTTGRGRLNREWLSPKGGLWFSIVLRPKLQPDEVAKLVFVASLAVAEVLRTSYGLKAETRWPNDVLVKGRKVCGILAETKTTGETVNFVVIGIGINVNFNVRKALPPELWQSAASIKDESGRKVELESLTCTILENLESLYDSFLKNGFGPVLERWKKLANFLGRKVEVTSQTEKLNGSAYDVDESGALVLRLVDGTFKRVFVGDVSLNVK